MATETEIIDLTSSTSPSLPPPSSSMPARILHFGSGSGSGMPYWSNFNPNFLYTNLQQITTQWQASGHTYHPSPIASTFLQPTMHAGQAATVLEAVPNSNAVLFPNGTTPLTPREHEYGRGRWSKIVKHFLRNKTQPQVQSYAASFYRNVNRNLIGASSSYSMPMIANEPHEPQTLTLFPEKAHFFPVPPCGEASSSNEISTYGYGFQMETGGDASTSKNASGNGEVDLELRLAY